jgi:T5SS/PEP-CTERM-associated repeat protein/autotransporter-associated beta strand protein
VTVDGTGSSLQIGNFINPMVFLDALRVGIAGNGTLNIVNGGGVGAVPGLVIAGQAGSRGVVNIDGRFSRLSSQTIVVGDRGNGTLNIRNGAGMFGGVDMIIASQPGSTGEVTVTGAGSFLQHVQFMSVGSRGAGTLNILNGATVSVNTTGSAGIGGVSTGTVTVNGAGSTWTTGSLTIGGGFLLTPASGTLTIQNGGVVTAGGQVLIARDAGAVGTLNIGAGAGATAAAPGTLNAESVVFGKGTGRIVFNHTSTDYTFASRIGQIVGAAPGNLLIEAGTTNLTANSTFTGTATVNGGTLLVNGSIANSNTTVNAGGTLGDSGIVGNTTINGGTLAPGNSIGTLTVQGSRRRHI